LLPVLKFFEEQTKPGAEGPMGVSPGEVTQRAQARAV
jgi:hypothetical protein